MTTSASSPRFAALDVLRGAVVAGTLIITLLGGWAYTYPHGRHADWNGWTREDLVFSAFLFSVGAASGLSLRRATMSASARARTRRRAARRAVSLLALGLALEATYNLPSPGRISGRNGLENLRLPGVLQRIGLCYAPAAALVLGLARRPAGGGRKINV